ncbi:hypothetical protein JY651_02765 [Pyxidicoccus parkwayensis]|uniref:Uncharacterized protein n=1 Tax=Pyxidicoccus parkwayensis TaxID=2813578 RepID=A0ABX7NYJ1_9BACT|nr:hypothetical protein [Pyxidicoccus parkwaysis]QSQ23924.1 hypothetical protein JY651_02765 [Pyxidicoccus parkwaysis]
MGNEVETELKCLKCGGPFGESTVEGGIVSTPCLACGYVMQGIYCAAVDPQPLWRIRIHWSGKGPTLKEAALLRQFLPKHAHYSIQEVRGLYAGATEWSERMLSKDDMLQLRAAAEARGFQVETEEEGENIVWPKLPMRPITSYGAEFNLSFHPKGAIFATFGELGSQVIIASDRSPTTTETETVDIPLERGVRFLDEIAALDPLGIPNALPSGIDGMTVEGFIREAGGAWKFHAWSPDPRKHPRQHGFILALYQLASDLARQPALIEFLEDLHGYLQAGLPVKVYDGTPRRIR